jgi:hypothetical protein
LPAQVQVCASGAIFDKDGNQLSPADAAAVQLIALQFITKPDGTSCLVKDWVSDWQGMQYTPFTEDLNGGRHPLETPFRVTAGSQLHSLSGGVLECYTMLSVWLEGEECTELRVNAVLGNRMLSSPAWRLAGCVPEVTSHKERLFVKFTHSDMVS